MPLPNLQTLNIGSNHADDSHNKDIEEVEGVLNLGEGTAKRLKKVNPKFKELMEFDTEITPQDLNKFLSLLIPIRTGYKMYRILEKQMNTRITKR